MKAPKVVESTPPQPWHTRSVAESITQLGSDPERGLTTSEATHRLQQEGPNELNIRRKGSWWKEAREPLTEPLVLLLLAVAVLYGILGELADAITILIVIVTVASVEVANEGRARKAIGALRALSAPNTVVVRDVPPNSVVTSLPGRPVPRTTIDKMRGTNARHTV